VPASHHRAAVEKVLDARVCVRWEKVDRSRAELDEIMAEITRRNLDGVGAVAIDTLNDRVEVIVYPPEDVAQLSLLLGSEYGAGVDVAASSAAPSL
jgi:hypothetical protein